MRHVKDKNTRKLKLVLVSLVLATLGIIATVFIGYRHILNKDADLISAITKKANIAIGKFHHTATRDGIKEWTLDARTAQVINAQNQAIFQDPTVIFFMKDNTQVYLTADHGILHTDSNDIEVSGNVVVKNENYRLTTEKLNYQHVQRIIFSRVPVKIVSASSQLTADSMSHDINANQTVFKGNIKGAFGEKILL
ncbi:MAG: LPS export ABC transporter periplasmic protein LptC [Desulfobacterales bacterium]|uniref:LPS export ABC transporter periplasmic protein LptC n=1 Tax=Candidatus Desulfatibia profunda TaxID=2841695 RepID=A0A8J6TKA1_9BACT|nr:LPS export ABC transporter periplasmic protein LptC [Candidatus Desulfatibia profunda]MBL7180854.1 LPS export ABC transporter periplasmic protein LptC [Desulfobacterales bacterium]